MKRLAGKFLVIDGPDGAGKSTQIELLAGAIGGAGVRVVTTRDPGGTAIGDQIRGILLDNKNSDMSVVCETLLYMASRAQLYGEVIGPALEAGACVLCDRWLSSTLAYQAAAGQIGESAVTRIAEAALERVWPDLTVILDLPAEAGLERVGARPDRMEAKGAAFHRAVREAFRELAGRREDVVCVDAGGTVEEVHSRVVECVTSKLGKFQSANHK